MKTKPVKSGKGAPGARPTAARLVLATLAVLLVTVLSVTGCVSIPSGGPVKSYPMTQGTAAQNQPYVQLQPQPPGRDWSPSQIVEGFLAASASFGTYAHVVQQYLTPKEQKIWSTQWSAIVYKSGKGPNVAKPTYPPTSTPKNSTTATVKINGTIQATLQGSGSYSSYSVPSGSSSHVPDPFRLQKLHGQWRISFAPPELLLTSDAFENDYQLRNLYFFDPASKYLVPDPVYVPLEATPGNLMSGLVNDLITPPTDWLSATTTQTPATTAQASPGAAQASAGAAQASPGATGAAQASSGAAQTKPLGATKTAFPPGTKLSGVTLSGATAVVSLTGSAIAKANSATMQQVSAQLLSTLSGAVHGGPNGQAVKSVEVQRNGKPWVPPKKQGNPVQQGTTYHPAYGSSKYYYYVDSSGYLASRLAAGGGKTRRLAKIGTGYSQIAVSPDGNYVSALRNGILYAGIVHRPLVKRGSGYVSMSWDFNDDLWATKSNQIVMFRASPGTQQPLGEKVPVTVNAYSNLVTAPFADLKVAPDGVRVAIIMQGNTPGNTLTFGAISGRQGPNPEISLSTVQYQPAPRTQSSGVVNFTALSWYGPDNVIALAAPGPVVTRYPVSGGNPVPIPADPDMLTIAASLGQPLIAGLPEGKMASDASPTASWMPITESAEKQVNGSAPIYPG